MKVQHYIRHNTAQLELQLQLAIDREVLGNGHPLHLGELPSHRVLQQTAATVTGSGQGEVTVVKTARQLKDAVLAGAANIEIQQHMDITELELEPSAGLLGVMPKTLQSIRVWFSNNCVAVLRSNIF